MKFTRKIIYKLLSAVLALAIKMQGGVVLTRKVAKMCNSRKGSEAHMGIKCGKWDIIWPKAMQHATNN